MLHAAHLLRLRLRISSLPVVPWYPSSGLALGCLVRLSPCRAGFSSSNSAMEGSGRNSEAPQVAVIGAGVAGSVCASLLAAKGLAVHVFDSGRGPGGRMSQRRENGGDGSELMFDHGAQYFTVKTAEVQHLVDKWQASGLVADWEGRFGSLNVATGDFVEETAAKKRYVGVPGMNSICKALTTSPGVQAKYGVQVVGLEWVDEGVGTWCLKSKDGENLGKFNAVVVADKGAAKLLFGQTPLEGAGLTEVHKKVAALRAAPCFAVMMAFPSPLNLIPLDGFLVEGSKIVAWAARDSSKPGRVTTSSECWVVHSTAEYATGIIAQAGMSKPSNELLAAVANDLLTGFQSLLPNMPTPTYMKAHRWGGAFPTTSIAPEEKCIVIAERRVAVCGDFCVSPKVEGAILSGMHASERLGSLL